MDTLTLRTPAYGADYREHAAYLNAEHPLAPCAACGGTRQYVAAPHPRSGFALATVCGRCKLLILPVGSIDGDYTWHAAWTWADIMTYYEYVTRTVGRSVQVDRVDARAALVARYRVGPSAKCQVWKVPVALAQAHRERQAG